MAKYRDMTIEDLVAALEQERTYAEWLTNAMRRGVNAHPEAEVAQRELHDCCRRMAIILANLASKGKQLQRQEEQDAELPF